MNATTTTLGEKCEHYAGLQNRVFVLRWHQTRLATFGVFAGLGGLVGTWMALARMHQAGLAPERYAALLFAVVPVAAVLGSRLLSALLEGEPVLRAPWLLLRKHGFCFQGGLALAVASICATAFAYHLDLLLVLDSFALSMPLAHVFGRLGCHTYGCCHGRPTRLPLSVRYTNPESKAVWRSGLAGVPLHPTQLYSAAGNLALFAVLAILAERPLAPGQLSALFLILGSSGRFAVEHLRGVPTRRLGSLSSFQLVAAALVLCGVAMLWAVSGAAARPLFAHESLADALALAGRHAWPILLWVFTLAVTVLGLHGQREPSAKS